MNLSKKWLTLSKRYIDQWMKSAQKNPDVSLKEWEDVKLEYKKTYGKDYEREN